MFASSAGMGNKPTPGSTEDLIDQTIEDSFPASDPPAWGAVAIHERLEKKAAANTVAAITMALTAVGVGLFINRDLE